IYLAGAALVAAGFADFALITYHFQRASVIPNTWVPVFYSIAMGLSGLGSLTFGHLFDRVGLWILIPLTLITAAATPLLFLGGFWEAMLGRRSGASAREFTNRSFPLPLPQWSPPSADLPPTEFLPPDTAWLGFWAA